MAERRKQYDIRDYIQTPADLGATMLELVKRIESPDWRLVQTGVAEIDRHLTLAPGEITMLAGRPGMGKTTLAEIIAIRELRLLSEQNDPRVVVFVSLEETDEKLTMKLGKMPFSPREIYRKTADMAVVRSHSIRVAKTLDRLLVVRHPGFAGNRMAPSVSTGIILRAIEQIAADWGRGVSLVIMDYIQRVKDDRIDGITDNVRAAAHGAAMIGRATGAHVLVTVQASRDSDHDTLWVPSLGHMMHAADLEQRGDNVVGISRPWNVPGIREIIREHGRAVIEVDGVDDGRTRAYDVTPQTLLLQINKCRVDEVSGARFIIDMDVPRLELRAARVNGEV